MIRTTKWSRLLTDLADNHPGIWARLDDIQWNAVAADLRNHAARLGLECEATARRTPDMANNRAHIWIRVWRP